MHLTRKDKQVCWSEENIEILKRGLKDGLTASEIAIQVPNATKNSIIGKKNRLGLSESKETILVKKKIENKKPVSSVISIAKLREKMMAKPEALLPPTEDSLIPFDNITSKTCRSIEGYKIFSGRKTAMFCSNEKAIESSFCLYHHNIYYQRRVPR